MKIVEMPEIDQAIWRESYEFLSEKWPEMLTAVEMAVSRGASAEEVKRRVLGNVEEERKAIALRCQQAAAWLISQNGDRS